MEIAKITSKGQLTLPISIRRQMGLDYGDKIGRASCRERVSWTV